MAKKQPLIALLRGVNVGGHGSVPMPRLRELLTDAGYENVRTYVQSGNILVTTTRSPAALAKALRKQIATEFDVDTPVVVRTRDEIADVIERDPLGKVATVPKLYQVTFFDDDVPDTVADKLAALDVEPEQFVVSGREIYSWHPNGSQKSKLWSTLAGKKLAAAPGTARNWNTVTKLLALADD